MTEKFLEHISKNWEVLKQAPLVFVSTLVLAVILAWLATNWIYKQRIETLQERLAAKDDQLTEYRERLRLAPTDQTAFSRLSNAELRQRALNLVGQIRDFLRVFNEETQTTSLAQFEAIRRAQSEDERRSIWQQGTGETIRRYSEVTANYDRRFKAQTIVLRDELLSRLPGSVRPAIPSMHYEHPTNPIGMGMVADDLERLVRLLP